ncbi:hypothetical protein EJ05DRAFT_210562 [Pseudovirgaria hyperparasitica]|uniref:Uncharacterized protein n=1 Tax=Pseudovirgaria hyperparasitica TaxID=470096 RepID=A0A6A6VRT2_9PEZI|nr:uncharacterized protein EJ05DRAFT_210562 [Pseudovirgaria hyperparasitica]KAF2753302.1 hypothetical protein EJ05DRAFT_210562 [Pseudovirgaria hyperparasitica]
MDALVAKKEPGYPKRKPQYRLRYLLEGIHGETGDRHAEVYLGFRYMREQVPKYTNGTHTHTHTQPAVTIFHHQPGRPSSDPVVPPPPPPKPKTKPRRSRLIHAGNQDHHFNSVPLSQLHSFLRNGYGRRRPAGVTRHTKRLNVSNSKFFYLFILFWYCPPCFSV